MIEFLISIIKMILELWIEKPNKTEIVDGVRDTALRERLQDAVRDYQSGNTDSGG